MTETEIVFETWCWFKVFFFRFKVKMAYTVDQEGKQYRIDAEDVKKTIFKQRKASQTVFWLNTDNKNNLIQTYFKMIKRTTR